MKLRSLNNKGKSKFVNNERGRTNFTISEDKFIKENYLLLPVKTIGKRLGRSACGIKGRLKHYNLIIPIEIIESRKIDSYKKSGCVPLNKGLKQTDYMTAEGIERSKGTRFKKGNVPHNALVFKNGDIKIRTNHLQREGKQYKWIRLEMGQWKMYHHYVWENVYGPKPEGAILRFIDGNQMNCSIDNLELIDMATNMSLNNIQRFPDELKRSIRLLSKLKKELQKQYQNGKK